MAEHRYRGIFRCFSLFAFFFLPPVEGWYDRYNVFVGKWAVGGGIIKLS